MEPKSIKLIEAYSLRIEDNGMGGILTSCSSKCLQYTFAGEFIHNSRISGRTAYVSVICKASRKVIGRSRKKI